jgi:hypothetical protein
MNCQKRDNRNFCAIFRHGLDTPDVGIAPGKGVPLVKIGKLVGHQRCETTGRYSQIADRSLLDASDMFSDAITKLVQ